MALIVLHNKDSQGSRAGRAFGKLADVVYEVEFINGRIHPASMQAIRKIAAHYPGPNTVMWMGHGNESQNNPGLRGHPLTGGMPPRRIATVDLIRAFRLLNPRKIYLFTCMGMRWVRRSAQVFYDEMRFLDPRIKIFAATTRISGALLGALAKSLANGVENPPGAFNRGRAFEEVEIFGETFLEWQHRVNPQRSSQGAWEAPF